jgi:hypothetical protein
LGFPTRIGGVQWKGSTWGVFESARARTARCRHGASVCTAPPALSPSVHHEGAELKPAFCTLGHTIPLYLVPSPISLDRQGMQDKPMCGAANKYFLKGEIYLETCKKKKNYRKPFSITALDIRKTPATSKVIIALIRGTDNTNELLHLQDHEWELLVIISLKALVIQKGVKRNPTWLSRKHGASYLSRGPTKAKKSKSNNSLQEQSKMDHPQNRF